LSEKIKLKTEFETAKKDEHLGYHIHKFSDMISSSAYIASDGWMCYKKIIARCMKQGGHYTTNRKVAGSRRDEVNEFFPIYVILPAALGFTQPLIEMSTRIRKIMFLVSRARSVLRTDDLTAICERIV
jgi:hypothetical protein